ncbi:GCN5-like N-acetyltransferase (plastid) [Chondrus crispus]|uniref:GCN5-like N-acetyltransferase n=1 Tax=Chondrus crispus TaxID=2769 RepID=M5DCQ5_CHOCR|nr:GCN5-like N-acetyltransferase [Chondrus crispus]CCP38040.1 GCN5-like N-acetyltransferase [Chondrus crispus]|eukprot:YP_007627293.1 GCN5-like N-acetyltransferase (plastid) [Chondrus crispus]
MAFWKKFFKNINMFNQDKNSINIKKEYLAEDLILIKHLENQGNHNDIYISTGKNINLYELEQLCDSVGWVRRPLKKVKLAIDHSFVTICVFYKNNKSKKLIGFARATSDTVFNATIWDVVIHPNFQGKGLGKALMDQIVIQLRYSDISTITLFADPHVVSFYRRIGFITDPDGIKGMFWYPR